MIKHVITDSRYDRGTVARGGNGKTERHFVVTADVISLSPLKE